MTEPQTSPTARATSTETSARPPRTKRGRGRFDLEGRGRTMRGRQRTREDRADLDGMYLSEMAASTVLSHEEEVSIAQRIVAAERASIEAVVRAPAGARELARKGDELGRGELDVKVLLLNPDQEGIDLGATRDKLSRAFQAAPNAEDETVASVVDTLIAVRVDPRFIASVVESIAGEAERTDDPADRAALAAASNARRELRRSKERLVVGNLRLVVLFARKYLGRGVPLLDLVQEGNLGLMRAADKFDHRRGFRFSTYAAWWIKQALQRALLDRSLRLPVHVADDRRRIGKVRATFAAQHEREPTAEEIASLTGLARERVENILSLPAQPASLDAPVGEEGESSLGDFVPSATTPPDDDVAHRALGGQLEGLLAGLSPREQQVLRLRFGMGGAREHTLEEVGREMSLTRERIRQIERVALDKLRARSERVQLKSYLER